MTAIPKSDRWGPFNPAAKPAERLAGLRSLRLAVRLHCGPRGQGVERLLKIAEQTPDDSVLNETLRQLGRLDALDKRRVWSSFAALTKPEACW